VFATVIGTAFTLLTKYVGDAPLLSGCGVCDSDRRPCSDSVANVWRAVRLRKDSIPVAFTRLAPFVILNVMAGLWATFSPTDIFTVYPRMFLWMLGLLNSKLVVRGAASKLCLGNASLV